MAKKNNAESFEIIVTQDQAEEFAKHIKNMVLFKMTLSEQGAVFPKVVNGHTEFSSTETDISNGKTSHHDRSSMDCSSD